eukprot:12936967-Prorocentrum_lima.AAC.1
MEPDTDTDSDYADLSDDEEYQSMLVGAGDPHARGKIGEQLCEAYFKPSDVGATSQDEIHVDDALPTDAGP